MELLKDMVKLKELQKTVNQKKQELKQKLYQDVYDNFKSLLNKVRQQGSNLADIISQEYDISYPLAKEVANYVWFLKMS